jgi:hypothetical protein
VFARVSEFGARPERLDNMNREGRRTCPAGAQEAGRVQRRASPRRPQSGKVLAVTLWESEQAMDATEEAAHWLLSFGAEAAGGMLKSVERYEVFFSEVTGSQS